MTSLKPCRTATATWLCGVTRAAQSLLTIRFRLLALALTAFILQFYLALALSALVRLKARRLLLVRVFLKLRLKLSALRLLATAAAWKPLLSAKRGLSTRRALNGLKAARLLLKCRQLWPICGLPPIGRELLTGDRLAWPL